MCYYGCIMDAIKHLIGCKGVRMAVTVRINEDNYVSLKQLADKERRSVVAQLDVILDEYFHRDTVGNVTPIENTPLPEKPQVLNPAVADLIQQTKDNVDKPLEMDCCQHPIHPCKHWVWDIETGEGYKNTLSGRYREAD